MGAGAEEGWSEEEKEKLILDDFARNEFYTFSRTMFKARRKFMWQRAGHHEIICNALMRVYRGQCKRLIINIPPRYGKTELAVVNFIAWAIGRNPDSEFIHTSYAGDLAANNAMLAREVVSHETYREIFPDLRLDGSSSARDNWRTTAGGVVYARGALATITGFGAGKVRDGFGGCFPYEQLVETEGGPLQIGDIVNSPEGLRVWSFNERTGQRELRRVVRKFRNPANHLVEVSGAGKSFRCTPDHEILTQAGWVAAVHLAKALDLGEGQPGAAPGLVAGQGGVDGDLHDAFGVLWLCVPRGVREALRNACPRLAQFDLPDDANADLVMSTQLTRAFRALENNRDLIARELCSGAALKDGERPVSERILHVVGLSAIREIGRRIMSGDAIEVPDLVASGALAYELLSDEVRNIARHNLSSDGEIDPEIPFPVARRFKRSGGACPPDITKVGHLVEAFGSGHWEPDSIRYFGHVDETFCLEVEGNHNFILAGSGAIVSNCIIIDDPHKPDEAISDVKRPAVIRWYQNTLASRLNDPQNTPIILIMQRLHEEDLAGWLLGGGTGEKWEHLCLPAIQEDGSALWPEKHSIEDLRRMEEASPYVFAGQYMQRPTPEAGGVFKPDMIKAVEVLPECVRWVRAWDLAASDGTGDWTVGVLIGITKDNYFVLKDVVRIRGRAEEVERLMAATAHRDGRSVRISIPQDPGQAGKSQVAYLTRVLNGYRVTFSIESGDKVTRALPVSSQINVGNVSMLTAEWNGPLISELRNFPFGKHDDQVDALSRAFNEISGRRPMVITDKLLERAAMPMRGRS